MKLNEETCDTTFPVCLYAQNSQQFVEDITAGWMHSKDDELSETEVDLNRFYLTDDSSTGTRHQFKRQLICTADDTATEMTLRLDWGGPETRLWVNGVEVLSIFKQTSAELQEKNFNFPLFFQINEKLCEGTNELCLQTQNFHGESLKGPICLQREIETHTPEFVQITDKTFKVKTPEGWDNILFSSGETQSWLGGEIQSVAVLKQVSGEISFLGVQKADVPKINLQVSATQPFDFAIKDNNIIFGRLPKSLSAVIHIRGSIVQIHTASSISIATVAKSPLCLSFDFSPHIPCMVNGKPIQIDKQKMTIEVPKCKTNGNLKINSLSPDSLFRYAEAPDCKLESVILAALESSNWRIQVAGVNIAGRFGMREIVPKLLELFAEEGLELPYPRLCAHWNRSKMNQALNPGVNHTPDPLLDPVRDAKRYRLRQAIIIALGQIDDPLEKLSSACPFDINISGASTTRMQEFERIRQRAHNGKSKGDKEIFSRRLYVHVFYSPNNTNKYDAAFRKKKFELKAQIEEGETEFTEQAKKRIKKYLICSRAGRGGKMKVSFNEPAYIKAKKYYGYFALVSNQSIDTFEALKNYRLREKIEEFFADQKGSFDGRKPRTWYPDSLRGRQFVQFVGLGYMCFITKRIKELQETLGVEEDGKTKYQINLEKKLKTWLEQHSLTQIFDWFDCIETTTVKTDATARRWSTETTTRDRLFLQLLGVIKE